MRTFLLLPAVVAALLLVPPATADEPAGSLLERLSAETTRLAQAADAQTAVLVSAGTHWGGILVGEPARFVVALDDVAAHGAVPREGKVTMSGGGVQDARLLDGDRELGLAVYELVGSPRAGLTLAGDGALQRGALGVAGGGANPGLVVLGRVGGPLDDVHADDVGGIALLSPGGRLAGLRPAAVAEGEAARGCAACHGGSSAWGVTRQAARWPELALPLGLSTPTTPVPGSQPAPVAAPPAAPAPAALPALVLEAARTRVAGTWYRGKHFNLADLDSRPSHAFVPAPVIERALADVSQGGRLRRAYLGVVTEDTVAHDLAVFLAPGDTYNGINRAALLWRAENFDTYTIYGRTLPLVADVRLASVLPDSPAAKAGLVKGARIVAVDGRPFAGSRGFARALARRRPGEEVVFLVQGQTDPVRVTLGDREKETRNLVSAASVGLAVQPLTPDLVSFLDLPKDTRGVVVRSVDAGSAAAAVGMQRGDIVLSDQAGVPIRDAEELDAVLGSGKGKVLLMGRRGAAGITFRIALPDAGGAPKAR